MLLNVVEIEKYYGTRNNLKKALACFFTVHEHVGCVIATIPFQKVYNTPHCYACANRCYDGFKSRHCRYKKMPFVYLFLKIFDKKTSRQFVRKFFNGLLVPYSVVFCSLHVFLLSADYTAL